MPICYLTRIVAFSATHRIWRSDRSAQQNTAEFGRAATEHGHRYQCRVTVKAPLHAEAGGVMSLQRLDVLLEEEVVRRFDGKSINAAAPEFADGQRLATGEALTVYVWERIAPRLPTGVTLHAVRVQEGRHLYSEYFGEA